MYLKSYIKSGVLMLLLAVTLFSCTKEKTTVPEVSPESALVKLSIHTPSSSVPKETRGNAERDESAVERIKLLVFENSGSQYLYQYMADGQQIVQSSTNTDETTFSALLKSTTNPLKIVLIANYNDAFSTADIQKNMSESAVKALLIDSFDHEMQGEIPLYGEIPLPSLNVDQNAVLQAKMLRAVARVDVVNEIDTDFSEKFELTSVHIYRANDRLKLIPDDAALPPGESLTVTSASVPAAAIEYSAYKQDVAAAGDLSILKTYLPESLPVDDESLRTSTATCVVVGGIYGDDAKPTYYRIDFNSELQGHPFGQVLRNHKYIFSIMQVNGSGSENPDIAAENEATSIIATMQIWDELTSEMWFSGNENYLGISSREIVLNYAAGSQKTELLQATVPFRIQPLNEAGQPEGPIITNAGEEFTAGFYTLRLQKDGSDGKDIWRLVVTSTADNYGEELTGGFQVFTDWWTFDASVIQQSYAAQLSKRHIRVLTITDLDGDLGTTDGTLSSVSGGAMRKVLENKQYFSPTGRIPIGGITVYDLKNETISTQNAADMYILEKVLWDVDVVHLPAECTPSVAASKLIADWHSAKRGHILIVGYDSETTNYNIEEYLYELEGRPGTWEVSNKISALVRAEFDDWFFPVGKFFNGPFGEVAEINMGLSKSTIGYNNGFGSDTVPILRAADGADEIGMMTHGINVVDGVFYCGDSGITSNRGSAMSDKAADTGELNGDFDQLMANIWAWIVERAAIDWD